MQTAYHRAIFPRNRGADNKLLQTLRPEDLAIVEPSLREWTGKAGSSLYEPGDDIQFVYFPCGSSLISLAIVLDDGNATETALIGREGAIGGIVSHGRLRAYARAMVRSPGLFLRLSTSDLGEFEQKLPGLRNLFARYAEYMLEQALQSIACNAVHTIEQRTVRWLLAAMDRSGNCDVSLGQEQLARTIGVGRTYISRVIQSLKGQGVLETRRGGFRVCDVERLKALSCGCNAKLRHRLDQALTGSIRTTKGARVRQSPELV